MVSDTPSTDLVFQDLYTCGTKPEVVRIAAIIPRISMDKFINQQYLQFSPVRQ